MPKHALYMHTQYLHGVRLIGGAYYYIGILTIYKSRRCIPECINYTHLSTLVFSRISRSHLNTLHYECPSMTNLTMINQRHFNIRKTAYTYNT